VRHATQGVISCRPVGSARRLLSGLAKHSAKRGCRVDGPGWGDAARDTCPRRPDYAGMARGVPSASPFWANFWPPPRCVFRTHGGPLRRTAGRIEGRPGCPGMPRATHTRCAAQSAMARKGAANLAESRLPRDALCAVPRSSAHGARHPCRGTLPRRMGPRRLQHVPGDTR